MDLLKIFRGKSSPFKPKAKKGIWVGNRRNFSFFGSSGKSAGAKWDGGLSATGETQYVNHKEARKNARKEFNESIFLKSTVNRSTDTVVYTGLVPEFDPDYKLLGLEENDPLILAFREQHTRRLQLWCNSKTSHRAESLTFYQGQRMLSDLMLVDNDEFMRLHYSKRTDLLNPLQWSIIDADQIGYGYTDAVTSTEAPQMYFEDGISRDSSGREKSYQVSFINPSNGKFTQQEIPRIGAKSGKTFMLHGYTPVYPGQGRGFTKCYNAIQELENLTDFSLSVIKNAINVSNQTFYVKPSPDAPSSNPVQEVQQPPATLPNFVQCENGELTEDADRVSVNDWLNGNKTLNYVAIPEADMQAPGSTAFIPLQAGENLEKVDNPKPSETFNEYSYRVFSYIASSLNQSVEHVLGMFNSNYMAARAALMMAYDGACIIRKEMESDFLDPTSEMWLDGEVAAGRVIAPGWSDPRMRRAWMRCNWIGKPMPHLDPNKEIKATRDRIAIGMTNGRHEARQNYGSDYDTNTAINNKLFKDQPSPYWEDDKRNGEQNDTV